MNHDELKSFLTSYNIDRSELAKLLEVTPRAIGMWCNGDREIPGPAAAYTSLFASLPRALQIKELGTKLKEPKMNYSGMYSVNFQGADGAGTVVLVLVDGIVFGHDTGGVKYDGEYSPNAANPKLIDTRITLSVPKGISLVQGVPAQPNDYSFEIETTLTAQGETPLTISTPFGQLTIVLSFLRELPESLAA